MYRKLNIFHLMWKVYEFRVNFLSYNKPGPNCRCKTVSFNKLSHRVNPRWRRASVAVWWGPMRCQSRACWPIRDKQRASRYSVDTTHLQTAAAITLSGNNTPLSYLIRGYRQRPAPAETDRLGGAHLLSPGSRARVWPSRPTRFTSRSIRNLKIIIYLRGCPMQGFVGKFQVWGSLVQISVDKIHVY